MSDPSGAATRLVLKGELPLVLTRAMFVASLLSLGGVLVFRAYVLPKVSAKVPPDVIADAERALFRLTRGALGLAFAGLLAWTVFQAAELAGASRPSEAWQALRPVLVFTQFGQLVLLQAGALVLVGVLLRASALRSAAVLALVGVALQAGHGHAMAMDGIASLLFWVSALHLVAASAWIGGLLPLLIVVRLASFRAAAQAARWFSPLGKWCVGVLAGSAAIQGWYLVGSARALFETPYGWMVLVKSGCFGALFGLAVLNRYELAPALTGDAPGVARRHLVASIALQTGTGLLAVVAAGVLSGLPPGMDMGRTP